MRRLITVGDHFDVFKCEPKLQKYLKLSYSIVFVLLQVILKFSQNLLKNSVFTKFG